MHFSIGVAHDNTHWLPFVFEKCPLYHHVGPHCKFVCIICADLSEKCYVYIESFHIIFKQKLLNVQEETGRKFDINEKFLKLEVPDNFCMKIVAFWGLKMENFCRLKEA
jgi:hypothetical protein